MEQLSFITHVKTINIGAIGGGQINAVITATFFITK